ncbi:cytochrome c oxidase subunit 3 [Sphingomonas zeae]|jgi:cytochrome o ubiquinol oxidase subunit III|uniref:Cytochrome bo(3) ubiquinol oxidase subunit 3 n=1 Tax=Sphingomonas zeae TaxID=1646122 RepID=A0A7Y6B5M0_9SPHN|nr:cytochrome c oxidase subunit 3 [Sphingomonas zeae]MBB4048722.1 cytochrome o ubiquinol oxidase subunit 3 [Sphingomonas zeae]NUU47849.1 cytochrome o ubiquinol oxidase subunit III [Sphingomonas zeae]
MSAVPTPRRSEWAGPPAKDIVTAYGFWMFLIGDVIMFASFFAGYAVLAGGRAGGPGPADIIELPNVAVQTLCLLTSTLTCALAGVMAERRRMAWTQLWLLATGLLGVIFLALEIREFSHLIERGATPQRSAFLSGFFMLVGCHGVHVVAGILWLGTMMAQVAVRGPKAYVQRRLSAFMLYWHALDIVWVGLFSIVYIWGSIT